MNEEAQAELGRIAALEPAALTDADKAFLRSRRSYLSADQEAIFAEALDEAPVAETVVEAEEAPKPKKSK